MTKVVITPEELAAVRVLLKSAMEDPMNSNFIGRNHVAEAIPVVHNFCIGIDDMVNEPNKGMTYRQLRDKLNQIPDKHIDDRIHVFIDTRIEMDEVDEIEVYHLAINGTDYEGISPSEEYSEEPAMHVRVRGKA
jgi:hypothetical protein